MAAKNKKGKTINDLAVSMEKGFKRADERLETTVNNLALMIGKGFKEIGERIESLRNENAQEHKEMIESNARDHEDMALRLDNVAYRFELVALQKRVKILEKKVIHHK